MGAHNNPRKDVLVADGLEFYRRMLVELLRGQGYRVDEAANAEEALARIASSKPDLVLLDANLPPLGAESFLAAAGEHGITQLKTVVVAPTAFDEGSWNKLRSQCGGQCVTRSAPIDDILVATRSVLFPEAKDLRRAPRAQAHIPVAYCVEDEHGEPGPEAASHTFNVSADGMFVVTSLSEPRSPGSKLYLRFWIPGAAEVIRTEGVVIWTNKAGGRMNELYPPGMGVMFLSLPRGSAAVLNDYVRTRAHGPIR